MDKPIDFAAALGEERERGGMPAQGKALGLAFSGGGIRSATFNLGVIQALAEAKVLRRFDYLSTISGGGYIGAWLSLFIRRYAGGKVADAEALLVGRDARGLEHPAIRFLRAFSNYLTPRVGLSKDTLVAVATYLRNLLLNLTILVTLLGAVMLLPRVAAQAADALLRWRSFDDWYDALLLALLIAPTVVVARCLFYEPPDTRVLRPWYMRVWTLRLLVDMPVVAAALVTAALYVQIAEQPVAVGPWFASVIGSYFLVWLVGVPVAAAFNEGARVRVARRMQHMAARKRAHWAIAFVAFAALAGAVGAALFLVVAKAIGAVPPAHRLWVGLTLGPPAVIGAIMLMVVAHIGFMGRRFGEPDRELWSVVGARLMALALLWTALVGVAFYGAAVIAFANDWLVGLGGAAWVLSTLAGVLAAHGSGTGTPQASRGRELLAQLAPYVFVAGLLLALSWSVHRTLEAAAPGMQGAAAPPAASAAAAPPEEIRLRVERAAGAPVVTASVPGTPGPWAQFAQAAARETATVPRWFAPGWALPLMAAGALLAALFLSWRVNINVFSLHHFYRNRLTRCFLGATNDRRRPHPLTGFDPEDDVSLCEIAGQRPLHIVGTAINLNRGRQLAWQNRRAASFSFTPLHAGYEPGSAQVWGGYRPVAQYGMDAAGQPMMLGTAIAISGAAASPNMGYHTSPAVAFLLTVFNVRLGHWCGDTRTGGAWRRRDPVLGLRYWLAELTGTADQDFPFVSLSDGGHFENLGIYELVRRRCALIVASDAGADPKYAFEDLAEAMRKCNTDFGVDFEFQDGGVDAIRPEGDAPSRRHHAVAKILYPDGAPGTLVYWKASITAGMPPDIMHYKRTMKDFPHQSTADQFFDESQFESYRHLGYEVARRSLAALPPGTL
ncbi:MAG: patatin-like phospholipase family protein [Betaproteobacteria bacterium]|nr:patatin-like phospholipase family protein [Betaproteobacteria bacterium]MDH5221901.1 patatin-like phospholipase family protein [Betaproteobacteria bacterium]MDH5352043.1 patatin-like phospholipase family protein [Betaproteobacteria bacterium]